jgi:hypothetical protein
MRLRESGEPAGNQAYLLGHLPGSDVAHYPGMNAKLPFLFCSIFPIAAATACGGAVSPQGSA